MKFIHRHSLSLASAAVALLWVVCYQLGNPATHWGSFFGNAIADWVGLVVTILATRHLYEASARKHKPQTQSGISGILRNHTLTLFLVITGVGWLVVYIKMDSEAKWGQVVGNLVSEWTQNLGFVLLTKRFIEQKAGGHDS